MNTNFVKESKAWHDDELADSVFKDIRPGMRLRRLVEGLSNGVGEAYSII
jgi:hypothetical protein